MHEISKEIIQSANSEDLTGIGLADTILASTCMGTGVDLHVQCFASDYSQRD